jgi:hypothetical protein
VTDRAEVFLGVIAVSMMVIALVQVAMIVAAGLLARRVGRLVSQVERDIKPIVAQLNAIGRDASRAAALAAAQVERADTLFSDIAVRIEQALNLGQSSLTVPAREGRALFSAFRAAVQALRDLRHHPHVRRSRAEDEDALFI